jgi:hypothetical protein
MPALQPIVAMTSKRKARSTVSNALLMSMNTMAPVELRVTITAGRREVKLMLS